MKRKMVGTGVVGLTLGALGCGDPTMPEAVRPQELFAREVLRTDSRGAEAWRSYLSAQKLHAAWAPPPSSPWRPFYKPTLIAAMSIVQSAARPSGAGNLPRVEAQAHQLGQSLENDRAAVFIDLPGESSVAWGAMLARYGFLPVVTFNNWPHQHGVLPLERPLGALLYYAREVDEGRQADAVRPAFILERGRLRRAPGRGGSDEFDNRYFHAASDFPSPAVLKANGITRVYYVSANARAAGSEEDDLNAYFVSLAGAGVQFTYVATDGGISFNAVRPTTRQTIFTHEHTTMFASSSPYGRSYSHYHYFWSSSRSTWGGGYSGTSSFSSGWSGFSS